MQATIVILYLWMDYNSKESVVKLFNLSYYFERAVRRYMIGCVMLIICLKYIICFSGMVQVDLDLGIIVKLDVNVEEAMLIVAYHLLTLLHQILLLLTVETISWIHTATITVGIILLLLLTGGATKQLCLPLALSIYFVLSFLDD